MKIIKLMEDIQQYYPLTNWSPMMLCIDILLDLLSELNFPEKNQHYVITGIYHLKIVLLIIYLYFI